MSRSSRRAFMAGSALTPGNTLTIASLKRFLAAQRLWVSLGLAVLASSVPMWAGFTALSWIAPSGECGFLCLPWLFALFCWAVAVVVAVVTWFVTSRLIRFLCREPT